ncbi:hypothetical protein TNIN_129241 [Trichonephila inaurata madagascariensis]|uniref:Uncharacterized protein n=1 Tax=Trichonephila inaurata madagascariensis TaxID=2747483 RepID=A0A8X6Y2L5_9ARAC|nr:hypothetical protein TNIN_129241 [Trichonephila inaurata madagascariensis]
MFCQRISWWINSEGTRCPSEPWLQNDTPLTKLLHHASRVSPERFEPVYMVEVKSFWPRFEATRQLLVKNFFNLNYAPEMRSHQQIELSINAMTETSLDWCYSMN